MAQLVHGRIAGSKLARTLGIDPSVVRSMTVHLDTEGVMRVVVERYVTKAELDDIVSEWRIYQVHQPNRLVRWWRRRHLVRK